MFNSAIDRCLFALVHQDLDAACQLDRHLVLLPSALSIVAHREKPDTLPVRAWVAGDIERVFPDARVAETPAAAYRFRAEIDRRIVGETLAGVAAAIDYDNFEGSVTEPERHDVYFGVWGLFRKLQC